MTYCIYNNYIQNKTADVYHDLMTEYGSKFYSPNIKNKQMDTSHYGQNMYSMILMVMNNYLY